MSPLNVLLIFWWFISFQSLFGSFQFRFFLPLMTSDLLRWRAHNALHVFCLSSSDMAWKSHIVNTHIRPLTWWRALSGNIELCDCRSNADAELSRRVLTGLHSLLPCLVRLSSRTWTTISGRENKLLYTAGILVLTWRRLRGREGLYQLDAICLVSNQCYLFDEEDCFHSLFSAFLTCSPSLSLPPPPLWFSQHCEGLSPTNDAAGLADSQCVTNWIPFSRTKLKVLFHFNFMENARESSTIPRASSCQWAVAL